MKKIYCVYWSFSYITPISECCKLLVSAYSKGDALGRASQRVDNHLAWMHKAEVIKS